MILTIRHSSSRSSAKKQQSTQASASASEKAGSSAPSATGPKCVSTSSAASGLHDALPFANIRRGFKWLQLGRAKKRLQMLETVSLGEKRFVALVQVNGRQFLIGGAPSNVGMLAELAPEETFHQVLRDATAGLSIPAVPQAEDGSKAISPQLESGLQPKAHVADSAVNPIAESARSHVSPSIQEPSPEGWEAKSDGKPGPRRAPDTFLDPALEEPFSLSPTLRAAVQMEALPPAEPLGGRRRTQAEVVNEERLLTGPDQISKTNGTFALAPSFTFQLSSAMPRGAGAMPQHSDYTFGRDAAEHTVSPWKLKGAIS